MEEHNIGILPSTTFLGSDRFVIWDCYASTASTYNRKLHFHDFYELSLIYEGESDFLVNGERLHMTPGTVHLVTPSDYHMQLTGKDQHFRYFNFIFTPHILNDRLVEALENHSEPICFQPIGTLQDEMFSLAKKLLDEYQTLEKSPAPFCEELIEKGIEALCILILRASSESSGQEEDRLLPVRRALSIIRRDYRRQLTLQEVSDRVFLSPTYFSQLFHKTMGISFSAYLTDYRLQMAARYLRSGSLPLKEIAVLSGFPTFPYFSAAFKKRFGVSPSAYLKQMSGERE